MRKSKGTRRAKGGSDLIVGGDGTEIPGVEIVQLPNKEVDVVRGECVVLLKIVESDEGKSIWEVPPTNMKRRTRVLGGTNDMHHRGVKRKGWRDMDLNDDQGVMVNCRTPLKVMERTNKKRGCSKTGV